jgi:succinoglycan biosynthesis protein ExoM
VLCAVCALTFHRPEGLDRLLRSLEGLAVPDGHEMSVIIVDNDPDGSARPVVEAATRRTPWNLLYEIEPERGISAARNTAVRLGLDAGADAIVFIDDDEWVESTWLVELIATQESTRADVVTGPVLPVFDEPPPEWVLAGKFFDRPRYAHNSAQTYATTSSVLMMRSCFEGRPLPFDPDFGISGGSDTHLFAQLREDGLRIHWSDTAIVHEAIPASRVDEAWLVRREYRRGQTLSRSLRRRDTRRWRQLRRGVRGLLEMLAGLPEFLVGVVTGKHRRVRGRQRIALGAGMISGLFDRRYDEYRTIHGR